MARGARLSSVVPQTGLTPKYPLWGLSLLPNCQATTKSLGPGPPRSQSQDGDRVMRLPGRAAPAVLSRPSSLGVKLDALTVRVMWAPPRPPHETRGQSCTPRSHELCGRWGMGTPETTSPRSHGAAFSPGPALPSAVGRVMSLRGFQSYWFRVLVLCPFVSLPTLHTVKTSRCVSIRGTGPQPSAAGGRNPSDTTAAVLEPLPVLGGLNLPSALTTETLPGGHTCLHWTDGDTEAQRGQEACPKPQGCFGSGCTCSPPSHGSASVVSPVQDATIPSDDPAFPGLIWPVRLSTRLAAGPQGPRSA